jgi:hypothetical protein|tara:strand:- start:146 stop:457 length:312 start_codon:yes stop_codon:yes gene_type:complete
MSLSKKSRISSSGKANKIKNRYQMNAIESSGGASSSLSQSKGNVDEKAMKAKLIKNMAMDYNVSISASGGGKLGRRSIAKSGIDSDDDYDESSAFPSESATVT